MRPELRNELDRLSDAELLEAGYVRVMRPTPPPEMEVEPEIAVAAQWWADVIRTPAEMDNGDPFQSAFATLVTREAVPLRHEQVEAFRLWLAALCQVEYVRGKTRSWSPAQPMWGSATRTLHVDYGPGYLLRAAADLAGIPSNGPNRFPIKTTMWVSPGSVKFRQGYGGGEVVLYPPPS